MLARIYSLFAFVLFVLPMLANAVAVLPRQTGDCNTGSINCCNSVQSSSTTSVTQLAGLLGIALPDLGALVGLSCSPLSVLGLGGNSCSQQPVCCSNNSFGGLIALGCNPINLNL
ncbi:fungal hydrophobin [Pluteus cervinus]|uniref:Fungal hydrophobin n=1 Tax=Pluteus cervinus TaxID=181527 RepID=A0ACD3AIY6_9AGAR|nr:fungal hydrophobin [Pluteus cervinus]